MTINLTNKELSELVQNHVAELVNVVPDRLKISFTKRGTQIDTSVEILKPGEKKSIIDVEQPDVNEEVAQPEPEETKERTTSSYIK